MLPDLVSLFVLAGLSVADAISALVMRPAAVWALVVFAVAELGLLMVLLAKPKAPTMNVQHVQWPKDWPKKRGNE